MSQIPEHEFFSKKVVRLIGHDDDDEALNKKRQNYSSAPVSSKKLVSGVGVAEWDGRWAGGVRGAAAVLSNCILIGS